MFLIFDHWSEQSRSGRYLLDIIRTIRNRLYNENLIFVFASCRSAPTFTGEHELVHPKLNRQETLLLSGKFEQPSVVYDVSSNCVMFSVTKLVRKFRLSDQRYSISVTDRHLTCFDGKADELVVKDDHRLCVWSMPGRA